MGQRMAALFTFSRLSALSRISSPQYCSPRLRHCHSSLFQTFGVFFLVFRSLDTASAWIQHRNIVTSKPSQSLDFHLTSKNTLSQVTCFASPAAIEENVKATSTEEDGPETMFPTFDSIEGLHPTLAQNLRRCQFERMTEIQAKTWESASKGQDVLGRARTGTGKVRGGAIILCMTIKHIISKLTTFVLVWLCCIIIRPFPFFCLLYSSCWTTTICHATQFIC